MPCHDRSCSVLMWAYSMELMMFGQHAVVSKAVQGRGADQVGVWSVQVVRMFVLWLSSLRMAGAGAVAAGRRLQRPAA